MPIIVYFPPETTDDYPAAMEISKKYEIQVEHIVSIDRIKVNKPKYGAHSRKRNWTAPKSKTLLVNSLFHTEL